MKYEGVLILGNTIGTGYAKFTFDEKWPCFADISAGMMVTRAITIERHNRSTYKLKISIRRQSETEFFYGFQNVDDALNFIHYALRYSKGSTLHLVHWMKLTERTERFDGSQEYHNRVGSDGAPLPSSVQMGIKDLTAQAVGKVITPEQMLEMRTAEDRRKHQQELEELRLKNEEIQRQRVAAEAIAAKEKADLEAFAQDW